VSPYPTYQFWFEFILRLGLGSGVIVLLTRLVEPLFWTAGARRMVWQACMVGLGLLFLSEATGSADGLVSWLTGPPTSAAFEDLQPLDFSISTTQTINPETKPNLIPLPQAPQLQPVGVKARPSPLYPSPLIQDIHPSQGVWWPGVIWFMVMCFLLFRIGLGRLFLLLYRRRNHFPITGPIADCVQTVAGRLGIRRKVWVIEGAKLTGPVAFGIFRPTIALPGQFAAVSGNDQRNVILAHELAHLANHDPAWQCLADLVGAILWWHPLVWWSRRQLRLACETLADEASLLFPNGPCILAECLVTLGKQMTRTRQMGWLAVAGTGFRSGLGRRVNHLMRLEPRTWRFPNRFRRRLALLLIPAVLLAGALGSTALACPPIFAKGDWSMNPLTKTWKLSLTGILVTAALGWSTESGLAADPPAPPGEKPSNGRKIDETKPGQSDRRPPGVRPGGTNREIPGPGIGRPPAPGGDRAGAGNIFPEESPPRIKVFRLKHRDPDELRQILEGHYESPAEKAGPSGGGGHGPGGASTPGGPGGGGRPIQPGPGGFPRLPGGPGALGPGGGDGGFYFGGRLVDGSVAVDQRTRSVIVRGTDKDLQIVADLVAVLDLEKDKTAAAPLAKGRNLRAFNLRYADANEIAKVLRNLNLNARMAFPPKSNLIIVIGSESEMKEIGEVIDALDVEVKP
jgi:hypothetical protein